MSVPNDPDHDLEDVLAQVSLATHPGRDAVHFRAIVGARLDPGAAEGNHAFRDL